MDCSFCGEKIVAIRLGEDVVVYIYICLNYDGVEPHFPKQKKDEGSAVKEG